MELPPEPMPPVELPPAPLEECVDPLGVVEAPGEDFAGSSLATTTARTAVSPVAPAATERDPHFTRARALRLLSGPFAPSSDGPLGDDFEMAFTFLLRSLVGSVGGSQHVNLCAPR